MYQFALIVSHTYLHNTYIHTLRSAWRLGSLPWQTSPTMRSSTGSFPSGCPYSPQRWSSRPTSSSSISRPSISGDSASLERWDGLKWSSLRERFCAPSRADPAALHGWLTWPNLRCVWGESYLSLSLFVCVYVCIYIRCKIFFSNYFVHRPVYVCMCMYRGIILSVVSSFYDFACSGVQVIYPRQPNLSSQSAGRTMPLSDVMSWQCSAVATAFAVAIVYTLLATMRTAPQCLPANGLEDTQVRSGEHNMHIIRYMHTY